MTTIEQTAKAMQTVLTSVARKAGAATGFIKRMRELTPEAFSQGLIFAWLQNPDATLEQLAQSVATAGSTLSTQALDQRFTREAASFFEVLLIASVSQMIAGHPVAIPLLQRFQAVHILDSSSIQLPRKLVEVWRGCGGSLGENAALKIQVRWDLLRGTLRGPFLQNGREHDRSSFLHKEDMLPGSLSITDLGYFTLSVFEDHNKNGIFWLSRYWSHVQLFLLQGEEFDLLGWLRKLKKDQAQLFVTMGQSMRVSARLIVIRVPKNVAAERRRKLRYQCKRKGKVPSAKNLALCDWVVIVTNVPPELLSIDEAMILYRARWQIELLFNLWKTHGKIDKWRSTNEWRILCEVYAKLIGMLLQHWVFLLGCWRFPDRSMVKAAKTIRSYGTAIALAIENLERLCEVLEKMKMCLEHGCRINKSRKTPRTWQLLLAMEAVDTNDDS